MPESPMSKPAFSSAPPGKVAMTAEEMKAMVAGQMKAAAKAIGGTVDGEPVAVGQETVEKQKAEYTYPVDEVDKKKYIRSLLSKEPFLKMYTLFGGHLQVSFRTMTAEEAEKISTGASPDKLKYRLLTSMYNLEVGSDLTNMQPKSLNDLDDVAVSAVYNVFKEFEKLCDELFRRANDPDFWTGTAGRT